MAETKHRLHTRKSAARTVAVYDAYCSCGAEMPGGMARRSVVAAWFTAHKGESKD